MLTSAISPKTPEKTRALRQLRLAPWLSCWLRCPRKGILRLKEFFTPHVTSRSSCSVISLPRSQKWGSLLAKLTLKVLHSSCHFWEIVSPPNICYCGLEIVIKNKSQYVDIWQRNTLVLLYQGKKTNHCSGDSKNRSTQIVLRSHQTFRYWSIRRLKSYNRRVCCSRVFA